MQIIVAKLLEQSVNGMHLYLTALKNNNFQLPNKKIN